MSVYLYKKKKKKKKKKKTIKKSSKHLILIRLHLPYLNVNLFYCFLFLCNFPTYVLPSESADCI